MRRRLGFLGLAVLALCAEASLGGAELTHTKSEKTEHFVVHYRPGSRAAADVEHTMVMLEREFARITKQLEFTPDETFDVYLYDDVPELQAITKNTSAGGFSTGHELHIPFDNAQTRYHELVHLIAHPLPAAGDEKRNLFLVEGLANALLEFVNGVHVHSVAAYYRKHKRLPRLREMLDAPDFYAWLRKKPGFNGYDVGGSFVRFLLDTYGATNTKRYYKGLSAKEAFGVDEAKLEKAWHAALDGYVLRPEVETLHARRHGEPERFDVFELDPDKRVPAEILGKPSDWRSLMKAKLKPDAAENWMHRDGTILGTHKGGQWTICELGTKKYGDCAFRARIEFGDVCGAVQLRLGAGCQAMLVGNGTFVWRGEGATASSRLESMGRRRNVNLMLVRRRNKLEIWVDGFRIVEGVVDPSQQLPGIGFNTGSATFHDVRIRPLGR